MEKLKRLPHNYAHNRRWFELKSRLWNFIRPHLDEKNTYYVIDQAVKKPDMVKALIKAIPAAETVHNDYCKYVDGLVELKGLVE